MYCLSLDKTEILETDAERDRKQRVEVFLTPHCQLY